MKKTVKRGNCYVTCETLYHLLGGRNAGWVPVSVKHEGDTHWYLEQFESGWLPWWRSSGAEWSRFARFICRLDPTVSQFKTLPDYSKGRHRGFLTKQPSKRAKALMEAMVWQDVPAPKKKRKRCDPMYEACDLWVGHLGSHRVTGWRWHHRKSVSRRQGPPVGVGWPYEP